MNTETIGNLKLQVFSGTVICPMAADTSPDEWQRRCVIFAYNRYHAEEMTFMLLPTRLTPQQRKGDLHDGCSFENAPQVDRPSMWVEVVRFGISRFIELTTFFDRPKTHSANTQRKIGLTIGAVYSSGGVHRKVETFDASPAIMENFGMTMNGSQITVVYRENNELCRCSVADFHAWREGTQAVVTELQLKKLVLGHNLKAVIEAACGMTATCDPNQITFGQIRQQYVAYGGKLDRAWAAFNELRHMALVNFYGSPLPSRPVDDTFQFRVTGKGWLHWSGWEDRMAILNLPKVRQWPDAQRALQYMAPANSSAVRNRLWPKQ